MLPKSFFQGSTLDDVMKLVIEEIFSSGIAIQPTKGECLELIGVLVEISNPRARLSRTETKGKLFSCLGELCWYLAQSDRLDFIKYYIRDYEKEADGEIIHGAYGPRIFTWKGTNQFDQVIAILQNNSVSRKAVIQLFDSSDIYEKHKDVPCTCIMQFLSRDSKLHMITYMRSSDVFKGLPHDVFCFTMLQEIIARILNVDVGLYKHSVGSMHLYKSNFDDAHLFLNEGWQSTNIAMPPMPIGDPRPSIKILLEAESKLRINKDFSINLQDIDPYWADLIRLLQIFRHFRDKNRNGMLELIQVMASTAYNSFIRDKSNKINITE